MTFATALLACLPLLGAPIQAAQLTPNHTGPVVHEIKRWSIREGLPSGEITALSEASDGRLWLGTFGGLTRFDGTRFEVFEVGTHAGLGSNRIIALCMARDGTLWIGTEDNGLSRYRDGKFTSIGSLDGLPGVTVIDIMEDAEGTIWVGTNDGLARIARGQSRADSVTQDHVQAVLQVPHGSLWYTGVDGLHRMGPKGQPSLLHRGSFNRLLRTRDQGIWIGGRDLLVHWDQAGFRRIEIPGMGQSMDMLENEDGSILVVGAAGLFRIENNSEVHPFLEGRLPRNYGRCALRDREGNLWIGGSRGLHRVRRSALTGRALQANESGPLALLMARDLKLWVAFYNGTLGYLTGPDYLASPFHSIDQGPDQKIASGDTLALRRDGSLIISSGHNMWSVQGDGLKAGKLEDFERPGPRNALLEDQSGALWVGDWDGQVTRIGKAGKQVWGSAEGIPAGLVSALYEAPDGALWVGTSSGLCYLSDGVVRRSWQAGSIKLERGEAAPSVVDTQHPLPVGAVRSIAHAGPDQVWVGSYGGGMYRVSKSGDVRTIGKQHGLHEMVVSRIVDDQRGNLVLQGNRALSLVSRDQLNAVAEGALDRILPRIFDSGPGIDSFEGIGGSMPLECRDASGALWFPSIEGLVRFDPGVSTRIEHPPTVLISAAHADGKTYFGGSGTDAPEVIAIVPGDRNLNLEFAVVTFVEPTHARAEFMLLGYDEDWRDAGMQREVAYTHVPPGSYRFLVRAQNRDGVGSEHNAELMIEVLPWFYEQLWFGSLLAVALGLLVLFVFHKRTQSISQRAQELTGLVVERTAELSSARDQLELRVKQRTEELDSALQDLREDVKKREELEAKLIQSQKVEAVGRLAGGLAHDYNNILTAILGETESIKTGLRAVEQPQERLLESVANIQNASQRAARLTRQLLAYSRSQHLQPEILDPGNTLLALEGMLQRLIRQNIQLVIEPSELHGFVQVDPDQLELVIINLVINARDAIQGAGRITLATKRAELDGLAEDSSSASTSYIQLSVTDTGKGIEASVIQRLFDPFFSTKEEWQGSGLGLASVDGIVRQSGGQIRVHSKLGQGTRFEVYLPEVEPPCATEAKPALPALQLKQRLTVLVCDDEPAVLRVTSVMIECLGHSVLSAGSPLHALELAQEAKQRIQVLLTDLVMPEMDGLELASRMRCIVPNLQVLYVSGYSSSVLASRTKLDKGAGFLSKPYTPADLERCLNELLGQERLQEGGRSPNARGE